MAIGSVKVPPVFAAGQVVGRHNAGLLMANDEYWNGQVGRWRGLAYGRSFVLPALGSVAWSGCHLYRSDMTTFCWSGSATAGGGADLDVTLKYGADTIYTNTILAGTTEALTGTYDLTLIAPDPTDGYLYWVELTYATASRAGASITFACPYSIYTGALSYTAPHAITDTDESATTEYAAWRNNDLFFLDAHPVQHGHVSFKDAGAGWGVPTELPFYWAWTEERWNTIYYSVQGGAANNPDTIRITYDEGGPNEEDFDIAVTGAVQSGHVHPAYVTAFDEGVVRLIQVSMVDATPGGNAWVHYLYTAPDGTEVLATSYNSVAKVANTLVYADGGGAAGRFAYLNSNDAHINACLEGSDIRRDYAVHSGTGDWRLRFVRRGDTLYYRARDAAAGGCTIEFGTAGSYTLTDYDQAPVPACGYQTLDLRTVTGLAYGMHYYIKSDNNIDWAVEV